MTKTGTIKIKLISNAALKKLAGKTPKKSNNSFIY